MFSLMHLQFFYDAARLGSVTEASRVNNVSQSALSQGIRNLERSLNIELTTHQKNRFVLTEAGRLVFFHAQILFSNVDKMKEDLTSLSGKLSGSFSFACTNSIARALIPKAFMNCRKKYPGLNVSFHRGSVRYIIEQLQRGNVDFAVVVDGPLFDGFEKITIKEGIFSIYDYPNSGSRWEQGVYVDHFDSPEMLAINEKITNLKVLEELSGWGMVEEFIKQGLGPGLLPDFMADLKLMSKMNAELPDIRYSITAVRQKGLSFSNTMKAFIDLL